jgi:hypothetical protein
MSRDREGAPSLRIRHKHRHRLTLSVNHISNRGRNIVPIVQPKRTPMARPAFSIGTVRAGLVQTPASVRFESVHYFLRLRIRFHQRMNVVRAHMRRQKRPSPIRTNLLDRVHDRAPGESIQEVRRLIHQIVHTRCAPRIRLNSAMSRNIMVPIHGTGLVAVQMRTTARERNQVRHARVFHTAPLRSRLGRTRSRLIVVMQQYWDNLFG